MQVEQALAADIARQSGRTFDARRFVPFVVVHEFEAPLFSDCTRFAAGIGRPDLAPRFQDIRNRFANPEEIDDSPRAAPSKRVQAVVPGYQKPLFGALAAIEIGLEAIRTACPTFAIGWTGWSTCPSTQT